MMATAAMPDVEDHVPSPPGKERYSLAIYLHYIIGQAIWWMVRLLYVLMPTLSGFNRG
jgi:hypothetical protein